MTSLWKDVTALHSGYRLHHRPPSAEVFAVLCPSPTFCFQASRNGATGVQLDLSFTADGVPVLMHDETLDRTTNGSGPVDKMAFVQLRRLDAGLRHRMR